jgi:hypothetical protein
MINFIKLYIYFLYINRKNFKNFFNNELFIFYEPRFKYICKNLEKNNIKYLFIPREPFYTIWKKNLFFYESEKISQNNELYFQSYLSFKIERNQFIKEITPLIKSLKYFIKNPNKILLPKVNDDWTIDFINTFHVNNYETFVFDREGTVTNHRIKMVAPLLKGFEINATKIFLYNKEHYNFFLEVSKFTTLNAKLKIIGNPASDFWFQDENISKNSKVNMNQILYFAFGPRTYLNQTNNQILNWDNLLSDIHEYLFKFLYYNKHITLKYKVSKKGYRDFYEPREKLITLPNVEIVDGSVDSNELIMNSSLIIGFQSTATIDSLNSIVPIIYPGWGETFNVLESEIIQFSKFPKNIGFHHTINPQNFIDTIKNCINKKITQDEYINRQKVLFDFTNNNSGDVAKNTIHEIFQ